MVGFGAGIGGRDVTSTGLGGIEATSTGLGGIEATPTGFGGAGAGSIASPFERFIKSSK
jgi:hypothetical protein